VGGIELKHRQSDEKQSGKKGYIQEFAEKFGVYDMKPSGRMPNTRLALAVAEFARDQGKIDRFCSLTMDAHWKESKDIENPDVLSDLAAASGLDPEKALLAADDPVYLKRVDDMRLEYKAVGTTGIPTFVFGTEIVKGCQQYGVLAAAALRAGAKPG
jgi:predicted DsbA family dithiol-disulfide isomerase